MLENTERPNGEAVRGELWIWIPSPFPNHTRPFLYFCPRRLVTSRPAHRGSERERERVSVGDSDLLSPLLLLLHPAVQRDEEQWLHSALGFQSRQKPQSASERVFGDGGMEGVVGVFANMIEKRKTGRWWRGLKWFHVRRRGQQVHTQRKRRSLKEQDVNK